MELVLEIPKASVDYLCLSNEKLAECFFSTFANQLIDLDCTFSIPNLPTV